MHLGNGGFDSRGDHQADIQVFAERNITLEGSQLAHNPGVGNGLEAQMSFGGSNTSSWNLDRAADGQSSHGNGNMVADLRHNWLIPGGTRVTIRDDGGNIIVVLTDSATPGQLVTDRDISNFIFDDTEGAVTIAAGTHVANMIYGNGSDIEFLRDMNPARQVDGTTASNPIGGSDNVWLVYEHADVDLSHVQIGNGGYNADQPNNDTALGNKGDIRVSARTGNIVLMGGTDDQDYAIIGHGGYETKGAHEGDIHVRAGGDIQMLSGTGPRDYTQIGHGGYDADGNHEGVIKVSAGSGNLFTSLSDTLGDPSGWFDDMGDFDMDTVPDQIQFGFSGTGGILLQGGSADVENYAQIGHGGRSAVDGSVTTLDGVIGVSATGDIDLLGGAGSRAYAQIGHGGWNENNTVDITGDIHVISEGGDLTVKAGTGSESYALIGHGDDQSDNATNLGGSREGGIQAIANQITLDRNGYRLAWIGHTFDMAGNDNNPLSNSANNALAVPGDNLGGGYEVIARNGMVLGNNGATISNNEFVINDSIRDRLITPNIASGTVTISGGNIVVNSLLDSSVGSIWENVANQANGLNLIAGGDIDVNFSIQNPGTGDVNLIAGADLAPSSIIDRPSIGGADYQRIDHLYCPPTGHINILGVKPDGTQFGNAHTDLDGASVAISSGEFFSAAGEISINAAPRAIAVGSRDGMTNVLGYGVYVNGGNSSNEYAQIGFRSINNVNDAGVTDPVGNATGGIMVESKEGGITLQAGNQTRATAQIGHGGDDGFGGSTTDTTDPSHSGMIYVDATFGAADGDVSILAGIDAAYPFDRDQQWALIGHGGRAIAGDHTGSIEVYGGNISVQGGGQNTGTDDSFAQIGHGGNNSTGANDGTITVGASGNLTLTAGGGDNSAARIGHGGIAADGDKSGKIAVMVDGDIMLTAGLGVDDSAFLPATNSPAGVNRSAQIGHGGNNTDGNFDGTVSVQSGGAITLTGGDTNDGYVQIGHGGDDAKG
ncbi:MAG: hypothetical protein KDM91_23305, partial [Verrucomicrobiae bacterium]|nr:hypothetical protein [Verrucomicrobiae bacterium]